MPRAKHIYKLKRSKDKQFFFTVHGLNGKIITTSETYRRKANAVNGIKAMLYTHGKSVPGFKEKLFDLYITDETKL